MFICLFVYYSVYRLVCQQGCTNTSEQISKSLEWRLGLGPQETTFTFQLLVSYRDLAKVSTLLSATPVSSGFVTFYWVQVSSAVQQTLYRCVLGMTQIKPIRVLFLISVQSQACLCLAHCYFNSATSFIQRLVCGCIKSYFISWNYTREKPMWVLHRN